MKATLLTITTVFSIQFASSQVYTTIGSGNFFNPLLWDCTCVPSNGDTLVVNHDMILSTSIYYNSGKITIGFEGSLTEDGSDRDVWVDGGTLHNFGVFDCYRLYISNDGDFYNAGTSVYFDSLWNQASISNTGIITAYDFLNDQTGSFNNATSGELILENNFMNQGYFFNNGLIHTGNDFSNCNIQTMDAMFYNHGFFCIAQDFSNCLDDTLAGTGSYYVGNSSSNFGVFDGNFNFYTPTGGIGFNSGTIDLDVNFASGYCAMGIEETQNDFSIYPNPTSDAIFFSNAIQGFILTDISGRQILSGNEEISEISIADLSAGTYVLQINHADGKISTHQIVKQ